MMVVAQHASTYSAQSRRSASHASHTDADIQVARSITYLKDLNLLVLVRLTVDLARPDKRGSNGRNLAPVCTPFW